MKRLLLLAASFSALGGAALTAHAGATQMTTQLVANGMTRPIFVTYAPGDPTRVFVIQKRGQIRLIKNGALQGTSFLDIDAIVGGGTSTSSEQGLLGLAFHPNYQSNGYFYVNYTNNSGNTVVARYTVSANPDIADSLSAVQVLTFTQPQTNHNGGWLGFGPDGYLYIAAGDGGNANDQGAGHTEPGGNAQDITDNFLGKMLRVNIDGDDFPADATKNYAVPADNPFVGITGDDEIWAYGLRNPWRNSFDRETGDLWIGDVGQGSVEEIDFQPWTSNGGENYGWRCMEGTSCTGLTGCICNDPGLTMPIQTYTHASGCSITGGYVYRGCAMPDMQGTYFYADYCSATIWSFSYSGGMVTNFQNRTTELDPVGVLSIASITSFGEDYYGEIYICDQDGGEVFKIVPATFLDCNANTVADGCDISTGTSQDINSNGIPDECECLGDLDGNQIVDAQDLALLLAAWETTNGGDIDGDGDTDAQDLAFLLAHFNNNCN